jgi:uncharacterized OB-fold protein
MTDDKRKCPSCKRVTRYIAPHAMRCGHCLDEITRVRGCGHVVASMSVADCEEFARLALLISGPGEMET